MTEIVRINLENEMDLILAHKRSMKLAELCGLSVITQTAFATAVSEISRCVIDNEGGSVLSLGIEMLRNNRKELAAVLTSSHDFTRYNADAIKYARRLCSDLKVTEQKNEIVVTLTEKINFSGLINETRMESFVNYFKKELPLSPYDELRKKNIQLLELSEKLKESETQYRVLSETLPQMIFTTNPGGYITYANKWLKDYFDLLEIPSGKLHWLKLIHSPEQTNVIQEWERLQLNHATLRTQAKLKLKGSNELIWHLISLIPLKDENNQITSWTGFFVDIHAQKLVEETLKNNVELKAAQRQLLNYQAKLEENVKELNKSNHDLEQFAYIASHDLQEPLRKIRNFTELLDDSIDDKVKAKKYLDKIDTSSQRMATLIKDVLNYSRLSKSEAKFENVDLEKTLENVKSDVELVIEEKRAVIQSDKLPVINGISQQLHQLFYNLINNSLKFSLKDPRIWISCNPLSEAETKKYPDLHKSIPYIELTFKDNGIGFDQKYAAQIFTIFKRLNSANIFEGTGIGLALCKKIVDNHHGLISAESEPGGGATFKIILPVG